MSPRKRFILFLTIAVGLLLLLLLIFGRGDNQKKAEDTAPVKPVELLEYADKNSRVVVTIGGRIIGDDQYRSIRISVGPSSRQLDIIQGYGNNVLETQSQINNQKAYEVFIIALDRLKFGRDRRSSIIDERGICPDGQRYVFEVYDENERISRTWSASCMRGTSDANAQKVISLFKAQITDYYRLTDKVSL